MNPEKEVRKIKKALQRKPKPIISSQDMLSTGSTLLNLACSDRINAGLVKGCYYFLVGDSSSGKTWLTFSCFAEASINPSFSDYRFIHDNAENGALMDIERYFGKKVATRIEPPVGTRDDPSYSVTVEDFYDNFDAAVQKGKPFIYVLDSMDALTSEGEVEQTKKSRKARKTGAEVTGSYGTSKPKANKAGMREVAIGTRDTNSILIIVGQTIDNIGFGARFQPKTKAGGHALTFFSTLEFWTSQKEKIKKEVRGKDRELGIISKIRVKKNRITGKDRTVLVPILHSYGIDDIRGCVDYLIEEKHWKGNKDKVKAPEPEFEDYDGPRDIFVDMIVEKGLVQDLRLLVSEVWNSIENECAVKREMRYD